MPAALEVVGPYRGATGYDRHTRELVRELVRLGVRIRLQNLDGWSRPLPPAEQERCFDELSAPVDADTLLHFTMPTHARPRRDLRNVNYTMFEAERIPPEWAARAAQHERIIVPTRSSREAWSRSGVDERRVQVSPLGVDGSFFAAEASPLELTIPDGRALSSFRYRFLNIAALRPRKNHIGLLRCWTRATRPDDDAVLILKTAFEEPAVLDALRRDLDQMLRKIGRTLADAAPVVFLSATLVNERLRALYKAATHYISLSRGEGWDLVTMEAAAAGLQLIAPRHSAYTDYLDDDGAELIESRLVPATFEGTLRLDERILFEGLRWWQPDEDAATALIRRIVAGRHVPKPSPAERIARCYSWSAAARSLVEALDAPLRG